MNTYGRKFSISVRIDSITPAHVRLSIFSAMILDEYDHKEATRARAGELCLRVDEFVPFIDQLTPHLISVQHGVDINEVRFNTGWKGDLS